MRNLKTGLAVCLILFLAPLGWISNPFFACIGTILAMQQTVKESVQEGRFRIFGTILGGVLGYIGTSLGLTSPFLIGFWVIFTIYICHAMHWNDAISITLTVLLSILVNSTIEVPLVYCFWRTWDTFIGVAVGILINTLIAPPRLTQQKTSS